MGPVAVADDADWTATGRGLRSDAAALSASRSASTPCSMRMNYSVATAFGRERLGRLDFPAQPMPSAQAAQRYQRHLATKGKAATFKRFSRMAATAANHWFGGDLSGIYRAMGESAPRTPAESTSSPSTPTSSPSPSTSDSEDCSSTTPGKRSPLSATTTVGSGPSADWQPRASTTSSSAR
jgi:hypothetical protein